MPTLERTELPGFWMPKSLWCLRETIWIFLYKEVFIQIIERNSFWKWLYEFRHNWISSNDYPWWKILFSFSINYCRDNQEKWCVNGLFKCLGFKKIKFWKNSVWYYYRQKENLQMFQNLNFCYSEKFLFCFADQVRLDLVKIVPDKCLSDRTLVKVITSRMALLVV